MAKPLSDDQGYRRYDRQLQQANARMAFRLREPADAECYFCNGKNVQDSQEHIVPQWLQDALRIRDEIFTPQYYSHGRLQTHRGSIPASNLVTRGICVQCNSGWMSRIEARFMPYIKGRRREVPTADVVHWFVKTAFVLNVSQNTRLLVPRSARLALAAGSIPDRVSVYFHRVSKRETGGGRFNWVQNAGLCPIQLPTDREEAFFENVKRLWACAVRIDDIVGTVVLNPEDEDYVSCWEEPGERVLHRGDLVPRIPWAYLPRVSHFTHCILLVPAEVTWADSIEDVLDHPIPFPSELKGAVEITQYVRLATEALAEAQGLKLDPSYPVTLYPTPGDWPHE